jgi:ubiquinone/menaquinone biosynthesis C-methylase UbiE
MMVRWLYRWACRRLYNELAWIYDPVSWLVSLGMWSAWRQAALDYVAGPRVLEVGFGTGELLLSLARRELDLFGLEISPAMQRIAAAKLDRHRVRAARIQGAVQWMPFPTGFFDCIVSTFPAEFILDPAAHRECARLLRSPDLATGQPGGRLVVVGMLLDVDHAALRAVLRLLYGGSLEEYRDQFAEMAADAGLDVVLHSPGDGPVRVTVMVAEKVREGESEPGGEPAA